MQHWTTLTDKRHREPEPLPYIDLLYSTAVNTRSRCVEQPWGRLFQLRCRGNFDATRWGRALATCRQTIPLWLRYVDDTYRRLQRRNWRFSPLPCQTERRHPVYQRSRIKWKTFFSRLFGKLRQQRGTNGSVQKTDATDRLFDESSYNPDGQEAVLQDQMLRLQASSIGVTGRNLYARLTENERATRNGDAKTLIAVHH